MEYTHLGRSGVAVSRLCLGTMNFGAITSEADAQPIMDAAHEHGINFFDTSNTYGQPRAEGVTESVIGRWLAAGSGRRDRTVLATKLYGGKGDWPNDRFLSALNIRRACEDSLRRLGTDHIDLYQMHHVDRSTPWDEIWEAMEVLRTQGKIIYVGSSNFAGWHIAQAQEAALRRPAVRAGQRAVPVQPGGAHGRAGSAARLPGLRHRGHSVEPAARRAAERGPAPPGGRPGRERAGFCAGRVRAGRVRRPGRAGAGGARAAGRPRPSRRRGPSWRPTRRSAPN